MEIRYYLFITALWLITACTETSVPQPDVESHEIVVLIDDSSLNTKCTLDGNKPSFFPGDELSVIDGDGEKGKYVYKSKRNVGGRIEFTFQSAWQESVDSSNIVAAFYPDSLFIGYDGEDITSKIPKLQMYVGTGIQNISAPMTFFKTTADSKVTFSNRFCLLRIGIVCNSEPANKIEIHRINVTASEDKNYLWSSNAFYFSENEISWLGKPKNAGNAISLVGCESAGAISTDTTYFYIYVPPMAATDTEEDIYTVEVVPVSGTPFSSSFTGKSVLGEENAILENTMLNFPPFILHPNGDSYTVELGH